MSARGSYDQEILALRFVHFCIFLRHRRATHTRPGVDPKTEVGKVPLKANLEFSFLFTQDL